MSEETDAEAEEETKAQGFRFTSGIMRAVWMYAGSQGYHNMATFWAAMKDKGWTMYDVLEAESP